MDEPATRHSLWVATRGLPEYPPLQDDAAADVLIVGGGLTVCRPPTCSSRPA